MTNRAIWGWVRQEATANVCLGTRAAVRERVGDFFTHLAHRREEVKRRCRTILQARAAQLTGPLHAGLTTTANVDFTLASVYHLWKQCNMSCGFCFAAFEDLASSSPNPNLSKDDAIRLVDALCEYGFRRVNFAGGEPTLCRWLPDLICRAKSHGVVTSMVTNGSRITSDWLDDLNGDLDMVALSIDSIDVGTQQAIGRVVNGKPPMTADDYQRTANEIKRRRIRFKVNTVVNRANQGEDLREFILSLGPERWKIFQVLPIQGQNDERIGELAVSDGQFHEYVERNRTVEQHGIKVVPENNKLMTGSYIMVDPLGRFFDNTKGKHTYSKPILGVGVDEALREVESYPDLFVERGGRYD